MNNGFESFTPPPEQEKRKESFVGVVKNEDGTLDYSQAAKLIEREESKEITVPKDWTILIHGTNLGKSHWQGENLKQLDDDILEVKGMGLSVIDDAEKKSNAEKAERLRKQGVASGNFNTTEVYSSGKGDVLNIRIIFLEVSSRDIRSKELKEKWEKEYGVEKANGIIDLADKVYWRNHQQGRHPILPRGMKLKKIDDKTIDGKREVTYVPESLFGVYQKEARLI